MIDDCEAHIIGDFDSGSCTPPAALSATQSVDTLSMALLKALSDFTSSQKEGKGTESQVQGSVESSLIPSSASSDLMEIATSSGGELEERSLNEATVSATATATSKGIVTDKEKDKVVVEGEKVTDIPTDFKMKTEAVPSAVDEKQTDDFTKSDMEEETST